MKWRRVLFPILLLIIFCPLIASAQDCTSDSDCEDGWYCDQGEAFVMLCEKGDPEDCPEESLEGICAKSEDEGFLPPFLQCETDSDCPLHFSCYEDEICTGSTGSTSTPKGDAKGEPGDEDSADNFAPVDEDSEETESCVTMKGCMYDPPTCEEDAECDEGFECTASEEICFGMGGLPTQDDCICDTCAEGEECPPCECDDLKPPVEEFCETLASICEPKEIACEVDSDCPTDWECFEMPEIAYTTTDCACPTCIVGEECPPCDCDEDTEEIVAEETAMCIPPSWGELIGFILGAENKGGGGALPWDNTTPPEDGEEEGGDPSGAPPILGSETDDEVGGENPSPGDETPSQGGETPQNDSLDSLSEEGGCSATGANRTPLMVLGLMLAFLTLVSRRRQTN